MAMPVTLPITVLLILAINNCVTVHTQETDLTTSQYDDEGISTIDSFTDDHTEEVEVPVLPTPQYDEDGTVEWFPRIVGGTHAAYGEFHAQISVQTRTDRHFCGGSLVHPYLVATAAHCVAEGDGVKAASSIQLMGDDTHITSFSPTRQVRHASNIFSHPDYDPMTFEHDIAIIRAIDPFDITNTFRPIALSSATPEDGYPCKVAGWGATSESGTVSVELQRVDVDVIPRNVCSQKNSNGDTIKDGMICAGTMTGGRDSCQGDSGGGLICNGRLTGIVSFGFGCARPNFPGVYTDVSMHKHFIDNVITWEDDDQVPPAIPTDKDDDTEDDGDTAMSITISLYLLFTVICSLFVI